MYNVHYNLDFSAGFVQRLAWKSSRWKHQRRHTLWSQLSTLLSVAIWYYIIHSEDIQEFKNGTLNTTRGIVIGLHPRRRIERTSMESLFSPHRQGQMEAVWAGDCRSSDDLDTQLPCWHRSLGDTSAAQRRSSARSCYCRRGRPKTGSASPPPTLRLSDRRVPAGTSITSAATSSPSGRTSPSPKLSLPLRSSSLPTRCRCTMGGKTCFTVHLNPLWAKN